MELLVVVDAYEEYEEIRASGVINMFDRRGVQEIAASWFGPNCALVLLTAKDYGNLLRTYGDWQAENKASQ